MARSRSLSRTVRSPGPALVPGLLLVASVACGGDRAAEPVPALAATDSSGVRIVASTAPLWSDGERWSIDPDPLAEFGQSDDPESALYRVAALVPLADGGLAVADGGSNQIVVFDSQGGVRHRLGREGDGPGEFRWLNGVLARGDSLVAVDGSRLRLSIFDSTGALARELSIDPVPGQATGIRAVDAGPPGVGVYREVAFTNKGAAGILRLAGDAFRLDWDGESAAPLAGDFAGAAIFALPDGMGTLPFGADLHMAGVNGRILVGGGDRAEIREYDADGGLARLIRWNAAGRPVEEVDRREWKSAQLDAMEEGLSDLSADARQTALQKQRDFQERMPFPTTLPVHADLHTDARGHLWVRRYRPTFGDDTPTSWQGKQVGPDAPHDPSPDQWWIFDPHGRWLGEVATPPGLRLEAVGDGTVWGVHRNALGVETVRSHRLVR